MHLYLLYCNIRHNIYGAYINVEIHLKPIIPNITIISRSNFGDWSRVYLRSIGLTLYVCILKPLSFLQYYTFNHQNACLDKNTFILMHYKKYFRPLRNLKCFIRWLYSISSVFFVWLIFCYSSTKKNLHFPKSVIRFKVGGAKTVKPQKDLLRPHNSTFISY